MSGLEIPDTAFAAGWNACTTGSDRDELLVTRIINAAAPIIVAAKLRQMADEVEASETDSMWGRRELRFEADNIEASAVNQ